MDSAKCSGYDLPGEKIAAHKATQMDPGCADAIIAVLFGGCLGLVLAHVADFGPVLAHFQKVATSAEGDPL